MGGIVHWGGMGSIVHWGGMDDWGNSVRDLGEKQSRINIFTIAVERPYGGYEGYSVKLPCRCWSMRWRLARHA